MNQDRSMTEATAVEEKKQAAYQRGVDLAEYLIEARADGHNPDIRFDLAAAARDPYFDSLMAGLNETLAKERS